jgi:hypothetical protein
MSASHLTTTTVPMVDDGVPGEYAGAGRGRSNDAVDYPFADLRARTQFRSAV